MSKPRLNVCHNCTGGWVYEAQACAVDDTLGSMVVPVPCPVCDGSGRVVEFG